MLIKWLFSSLVWVAGTDSSRPGFHHEILHQSLSQRLSCVEELSVLPAQVLQEVGRLLVAEHASEDQKTAHVWPAQQQLDIESVDRFQPRCVPWASWRYGMLEVVHHLFSAQLRQGAISLRFWFWIYEHCSTMLALQPE